MSIQYNHNLDEKILNCIKSIKNENLIDVSTLKIRVYYEDIDLIKGLKELFDYCYDQLIERGYKCTKKESKGDIYYGDLFGEKEKMNPSFIKNNKIIIICFKKGEVLKGGNFIYFIDCKRYQNQIWENTHILLNENSLYNLESLQGYGSFGYLVFSFPIM